MGSPVSRSHTMVVSRWLVMPMAAMSAALAPTWFMAESATPSWVVQISLASCSTQPGLGKYWVNSFCATLHISPFSLNRMQRLEVVPASSAMMYDMGKLSFSGKIKAVGQAPPRTLQSPCALLLHSTLFACLPDKIFSPDKTARWSQPPAARCIPAFQPVLRHGYNFRRRRGRTACRRRGIFPGSAAA